MIRYFATVAGLGGYFANLYGEQGCIEATIHKKPAPGIPWRLCYASCTGAAKHLQGQVIDTLRLSDLRAELARLDLRLNPKSQGAVFTPDTPGPWAVGSVGGDWCVVHTQTGRTRRIGRVTAPRSQQRHNYFDLALTEANRRNQALAAKPGASP